MLNPRTFSEIFEEIHNEPETNLYTAGWESTLDPAGLSQLIGVLTPIKRTHSSSIYRYPRTLRASHQLNAEEKMAYDLLNSYQSTSLHPGFYGKELKSAYRQALLKTHPDQGGTAETFQQVKKSYEILVRFVTKEA